MTRKIANLSRLGAILLIGIAQSYAISGCSSDTQPTPSVSESELPVEATPTRGGSIVIGVQQEPERLSEILNGMETNNLLCNLLFSKFVKYDDNLRLVPDLIEAIPTRDNGGVSDDFLTITYHLRPDAVWHDGRPVTSDDVRFTVDVIMDPKVNVESREGWDVIRAIETPDPTTVVFHLLRPYPDFVSETFYDESVLPKHILEDQTGEKFQLSKFHRAPIGSGPFKFSEWVSGSHITLVAFDNYYGEGPYLDKITCKFIPDDNTLLLQIKTGEIDIYDNANASFLSRTRKVRGLTVYSTPALKYEHLDLNVENPILVDKRVRQAIAFATNKQVITENVYQGLHTTAALDEHPSSRFFNSAAAMKTTFDPVRARRLLSEAGWEDTDNDGIREKDGRDLQITISATSGNRDRERTEIVLKEMYRQVGIDLQIENHNPTALYGSYDDGGLMKRGKFDIIMYAWLSSPSLSSKESLYSAANIPPHGQNHPRIRHGRLTQLLERGSGETDEAERVRIYHEVSEILVEETPVIPLFWYNTADVCVDRLRNFRPNPTQSGDTWNANTWYLASR